MGWHMAKRVKKKTEISWRGERIDKRRAGAKEREKGKEKRKLEKGGGSRGI